VLARNVFRARQIRNRPRHLHDPVIRPRAEIQFRHRHLQQFLRAVVQRTKFLQLLRPHPRIARYFWLEREPGLLALARGDDAPANFRRSLAGFLTGDFPELHRRHFDVQINPVQQRPGNPAQIILDFARRTPGFARHFPVRRPVRS
jgi:hypothetical protein